MIKIKNLNHTYKYCSKAAVKNINLHIKNGENLVIIGSSGSGKSTLLKLINRLLESSAGSIFIGEDDILNVTAKKAEKIRGRIGMIFQNFNLIERDSVIKNVLNGRLRYLSDFDTIIGRFRKEDYFIARESLDIVGLAEYENKRIMDLSGGEKQRVAIARTLSQKPDIILADEPVSNLDPRLMREIMDLLKDICIKNGITLVTSLHFLDFAKRYGSRIVGLRDGEIVFDGKPDSLTDENILNIYGNGNNWHINANV